MTTCTGNKSAHTCLPTSLSLLALIPTSFASPRLSRKKTKPEQHTRSRRYWRVSRARDRRVPLLILSLGAASAERDFLSALSARGDLDCATTATTRLYVPCVPCDFFFFFFVLPPRRRRCAAENSVYRESDFFRRPRCCYVTHAARRAHALSFGSCLPHARDVVGLILFEGVM